MNYCVSEPVLSILYEPLLLYTHVHMKSRKVKGLGWGQHDRYRVQHAACG